MFSLLLFQIVSWYKKEFVMSTSFNFGTTAATTTQSNLASKRPIGLTLGTPASNTGFKIPATSQLTAAVPALGSTAQPTANPGSAFSFSTPLSSSAGATTGLGGSLTLGANAAKTTGNLSLGGFGATANPGPSTGFTGFGGTSAAASTATSLGTGLAAGTGLGAGLGAGIGSGLAGFGGATTSGASLFSNTASVVAAPKGLGGVDPKTSLTSGGTTTSKPGDNKAAKETNIPNEIALTVQDYKNYVKKQKSVRENITRMSSKPMYKVQEEAASLRQLLSSVTNALQRNAVAIQKLKAESAQELKHSEIAQRTKETPPGLQYEHTAPTVYFQSMAEEFEGRMCKYRQQIEEMEKHLASLNTATMLTPQELSQLLSKVSQRVIVLLIAILCY